MSTLRLTTISNQSGSATVPSDTVINGSAKAWVSFNGTGTVVINGSFNVTSITDGGTGNYTVNFTNAMPDANYGWASASYSGYPTSSAYVTALSSVNQSNNAFRSKTTTGINFLTIAQNGSAVDLFELCVTIFR